MGFMESRAGVRVPVEVTASVEVDNAMKEQVRLLRGPHKIDIVDVSIIGFGAESATFFPVCAVLAIQLDGAVFDIAGPLNIKGEVRYCRPAGEKGKYRIGIKFVNIDAAVLDKIREYVMKKCDSQG